MFDSLFIELKMILYEWINIWNFCILILFYVSLFIYKEKIYIFRIFFTDHIFIIERKMISN